jgi:hypothetical protein
VFDDAVVTIAAEGRGIRFSKGDAHFHLQQSQIHVIHMHPSFRTRQFVVVGVAPVVSMVYEELADDRQFSGGCIPIQVLQCSSPSGGEFG